MSEREGEGELLNPEASVPSPLREGKGDPITGETLGTSHHPVEG